MLGQVSDQLHCSRDGERNFDDWDATLGHRLDSEVRVVARGHADRGDNSDFFNSRANVFAFHDSEPGSSIPRTIITIPVRLRLLGLRHWQLVTRTREPRVQSRQKIN